MNQQLQQQLTVRLASDIEWRTKFEAQNRWVDDDANFGVVARTLGCTPTQVAEAVKQYDGDASKVITHLSS